MGLSAQSMDRRKFLKTSAAGTAGLLIGFYFHGDVESLAATPEAPVVLNAWIHVGTDDLVTILIDKSEMGQSILTGLAMIARGRTRLRLVESSHRIRARRQSLLQSAIRRAGHGRQLRHAHVVGPAAQGQRDGARHAPRSSCAKMGCRRIRMPRGKQHDPARPHQTKPDLWQPRRSCGKMPIPQNVPLKDPSQYHLIGKPTKRLDTPEKVNGSAQYGIDMRLPGMLYAVVARCPVFGGKVASFDAAKAKAVPGVKDVIQISNGVAVVADNTWTAMQGRRALDVQWDEGPNAKLTSAEHQQTARRCSRKAWRGGPKRGRCQRRTCRRGDKD